MEQVFSNDWFLKHQKPLLWFANTKYGKGLLGYGLDRVNLILPNAVFKKDGKQITAEFRTHNKYAKRFYYEFKSFWKAMHWFDENIANAYVPKLNLGFDTLTSFPDADTETSTVDGSVQRGDGKNETYATIRAGAGELASDSGATGDFALLISSTTTNQFRKLTRSIFLFDTSAISADSIISSAVFSLRGSSKDNGLGSPALHVVSSNPASNTALVAADYGQLGATSFGNVAYASFSTSVYTDITLNATGLAAITKAGITKLGCRDAWDVAGTFGGAWGSTLTTRLSGNFADQTGTSSDPKLTLTYTTGNSLFFGAGF